MLALLKDEKPVTVRTVLACLNDILDAKPYLAGAVRDSLGLIDCSRYKDTMTPLIQKDREKLVKHIEGIIG